MTSSSSDLLSSIPSCRSNSLSQISYELADSISGDPFFASKTGDFLQNLLVSPRESQRVRALYVLGVLALNCPPETLELLFTRQLGRLLNQNLDSVLDGGNHEENRELAFINWFLKAVEENYEGEDLSETIEYFRVLQGENAEFPSIDLSFSDSDIDLPAKSRSASPVETKENQKKTPGFFARISTFFSAKMDPEAEEISYIKSLGGGPTAKIDADIRRLIKKVEFSLEKTKELSALKTLDSALWQPELETLRSANKEFARFLRGKQRGEMGVEIIEGLNEEIKRTVDFWESTRLIFKGENSTPSDKKSVKSRNSERGKENYNAEEPVCKGANTLENRTKKSKDPFDLDLIGHNGFI